MICYYAVMVWYQDNDPAKRVFIYRMRVQVSETVPYLQWPSLCCIKWLKREKMSMVQMCVHFVEGHLYMDDASKSVLTVEEATDRENFSSFKY